MKHLSIILIDQCSLILKCQICNIILSHKFNTRLFIYTPDQLKAQIMASHFHTTPDYIGPYFKRNTGITMRDYIGDYRRTLIQKRMASGHYSLKQIVAEFGLTDESHVSKLLKSKQNL